MKIQAADAGATCDPIFIHSLFRAGSTYVFNVFRRADRAYWCYQEPLHEVALFARGNPEGLLGFRGEQVRHLRHPVMDDSYFRELYEVSGDCLGKISKESIYDGYFAQGVNDFGVDYWRSLIDAAKGRPVIQECRTSSRIGAIKQRLGGLHIYLWRNPWDQWWSYKVTDYFDATSQLIINAPHHPEVIGRLRNEIAFRGLESDDLAVQIDWFQKRRLPPEESYLAFYVLWLLGLREAMAHADLLVNVDRLSDSADYRDEFVGALSACGVDGLDFSDCAVPQTCYGDGDRDFFSRIEDKAHGLLLLSGTTQRELDELLALRRNSEPQTWQECGGRPVCGGIVRDADRARALVLSAERREVELRSRFAQLSEELEQRVLSAEARAAETQEVAEEYRRRAVTAETSAEELRQGASATAARADDLKRQLEDQLRRAVSAEAHAAEQEHRAGLAASFIKELELRAAAAEAGAAACENRAVLAEARTQELEARLAEAEALAGHMEHKASAAEAAAGAHADRLAVAETTVAEIGSRLAIVEAERQHDSSLIGVLHAERDELQREVAAAQGSAHYWRLESDQWHERLLAVHRSNSWRVTAPIRALKRVVTGDFSPVRRAAGLLTKTVRGAVRSPAVAVARIALKRPKLRYKVSTALRQYPGLRQHLVLFVRNAGLMHAEGSVDPRALARTNRLAVSIESQLSTIPVGRDLSDLSANARRVYSDLKVALEQKKRFS